MHNVIISKIECWDSNKWRSKEKRDPWKGMIKHNLNFIDYIKGREGVDYTPLEDPKELSLAVTDKSSKELERTSKNGLFGHYKVGSVKEVKKVIKEYGKRHQPIFRGMLSISEADASELGYFQKKNWKALLDANMTEIGEQFNIDPVNLRWVAAFHYEKGHPHVHYMFWDATERIQKDFIFKKQQNKCREIFSKAILQEERRKMYLQKTLRKALILGGDVKNPNDETQKIHLGGYTNGILNEFRINPVNYHIMGHISNKHISEIAKMMAAVCLDFPKEGRMDYGSLKDKELKEKINQIVDKILEIPAVKKEKEEYLYYMERQYATYSFGNTEEGKKKLAEKVQEEFTKELYTRLANKVVKICKEAIKGHRQIEWQNKVLRQQLFCDSYKLIRAAAEGFMKEKSRQEHGTKKNELTKNQKLAEAKRQGKINNQEEDFER